MQPFCTIKRSNSFDICYALKSTNVTSAVHSFQQEKLCDTIVFVKMEFLQNCTCPGFYCFFEIFCQFNKIEEIVYRMKLQKVALIEILSKMRYPSFISYNLKLHMSINTKNEWSTKALIGVKNVNEKCGRQK